MNDQRGMRWSISVELFAPKTPASVACVVVDPLDGRVALARSRALFPAVGARHDSRDAISVPRLREDRAPE